VSELGILAYCAAVGFAAAAVIASLYQWITAERADFLVARTSLLGMVVSVLITMFAGPFIVARKILVGLRSKELSALPALIGAILTGMWSVCAGIFYVSLLVSA
jgi:hypothetical protein